MNILVLIICVALVSFAAISEAIMDKLNFHFEKSIFINKEKQLFWNPTLSWKNKWKEDLKTEKFIGSSTIFVFTTDAWHLFKFFKNTSLFLSLPLLYLSSINIILLIIVARVIYGLVFTLCFDKLLVKK